MKQAYDRKATTLLRADTEAKLRQTLQDLDRNLMYARTLHEWGVQGAPTEIEALVRDLKQTQTQMLDWKKFDQVEDQLKTLQAQIDGIKGADPGAGQRKLTALGTLL
jgi:peptidoglycan hydrolase CwlO-like protein